MPKVGDLVLELLVDGKKGQVVLKDFVGALSNAQQRTTEETKKMRSGFERVQKMGERLFFTINGFKALLVPLGQLTQAANDFDSSNRKLTATSKLTGASLEDLENTAKLAKEQYSLNTIQANELTIAMSKLEQKAGEVGKGQEALGRLLDLAAAQGLNAEQAMTAINQALLGIDEGTDKLFQKNPSVIYAEYAKQIGTTAGKLGDQEKAQALLNAVMQDGFKVQGEYGRFLDSQAGKTATAAARADELRAKAGDLINEVWVPILQIATPVLQWFTDLDFGAQKFIATLGIFLAAGWKLIPMFAAWNTSFTVLGVSIKAALGWIGLIITAATLLFQAWNSNLFGIRDALNTAWLFIKGWTSIVIGVVRDWAANIGNILDSVGELWKNVFTFNFDEVDKSWNKLKQAYSTAIDDIATGVVKRYNEMQERLAESDKKRAETVKKAAVEVAEVKIDKEVEVTKETEDELKKRLEAEKVLSGLKIANIKDEFARRRAQVEAWFQEESQKWQGHNEILAQLAEQKKQRLEDIDRDYAKTQESLRQEEVEERNDTFEIIKSGYEDFVNNLSDFDLSWSARAKSIFLSVRNAYMRSVQDMLKSFIAAKTREILIHTAGETTKTTATATGTATRLGIALSAIGREIGAVLKSIGVYLGQIAAKLFAFWASLGPFGLLAAAATVTATVAAVKGIINGLMRFEEGGIVKKQVLGLIGESGDSEAVIPLNQRGAAFMSQVLPQLITQQSGDNGMLNRLKDTVDGLRESIDNLELRADFDSRELAIIVEKGSQKLKTISF